MSGSTDQLAGRWGENWRVSGAIRVSAEDYIELCGDMPADLLQDIQELLEESLVGNSLPYTKSKAKRALEILEELKAKL